MHYLRSIFFAAMALISLQALNDKALAIQGKPDKSQYSAVISVTQQEERARQYLYTVEVVNTGTEPWNSLAVLKKTGKEFRASGDDFIRVGCKVFEATGAKNRITELRADIPVIVAKGQRAKVVFVFDKSLFQPGKVYTLRFDMVNELKFWFSDLGGKPAVETLNYR